MSYGPWGTKVSRVKQNFPNFLACAALRNNYK